MQSAVSASTPHPNLAKGTAITAPKRVLVIEDSAALCRLLQYQLQRLAFIVTTASDAQEALALVQRDGLPDLVILDVLMPEGDGVAIAQSLRQYGAVSILFMSALPEAVVKLTAPPGLVEHYLPKPFTFAHLLLQVRQMLADPKAVESTEADQESAG